MPELGKAYVQIVPSADGISGSITNVLSGEADSAGSSLGNLLGNNLVGTLKTVLAAAGIGAIITSAVGKVGELAEFGDAIDKNSQKMGISAQAYQEWDAVLQHSGTSMDSMKSTFKTLSNAAQDGNESFEALGISLEDAASMSTEDLFGAVISGLQNMEEGTERAAIANDLLGRGSVELGALLNTSAEDTQAMRDRVHELGGVMSDEAVKAAAAYQDSLQDMQTAISGLSRGMLAEFLPSVTTIMNGITEIFSGDSASGVGMVLDGLSSIVTGIIDAVPRFLEAGAQVVAGIVQGIAEHLPEMLSTGSQAAISALDGFLANFPQMLEAGFNALGTLIQGIINNLPSLIAQAAAVVATLAATIGQHFPEILQKGLELLGQLLAGIIQAIPQIPGAIVQIIQSIKGEFDNFDWLSIGKNIIEGIKDGITSAAGRIAEAARDAARRALEAAKDFLGINSPSRVMRDEVGKYISAGLAEGILDNENLVTSAMDNLSAKATGVISADFTGTMKPAATSSSGGPVTINVYQRDGEDGGALAERVADLINNDVNRKKAVFA